MKPSFIVYLCVASLTPASTAAQSVSTVRPASTTVEQLVSLALDRSPELQSKRQAIDRARGEETQAALRANPMLSTEQREELGGSDRMTAVMLAWPLELFRRTARITAAKAQTDVANASIAEAERQLADAVRRKAVAVIAAERRSTLADELASSLHDTYELLKRRTEEGAAAPLLRDQAYVEWQRAEGQRPSRRADVRAALAELRALVGLPADAPLLLADDLAGIARQPVPASVGLRADLREAAATVTSTTAAAESARQEGRLDLSVIGGYSYMNNSFPQLGLTSAGATAPIHGQFNNLSFGVSLTLPVTNRNQGAVAAAMADVKAAEWRQRAATLNADAEISAARARDTESQSAVKVYDDGLRTAAQKNLEVVRESFSLGRLTLADVLNEQRRLLDVEMGYVDALTEAALARTNLLFVLGVTR